MKKADYIKAVALKTATSEPVFVHKTRGFAFFIAADRPNDSYSTIQREGDNGVWLQQVKFIKEANGFGKVDHKSSCKLVESSLILGASLKNIII